MDEVQANGARQLQEGWMHIHGVSFCHYHPRSSWIDSGYCRVYTLLDERNIPPPGRIGDPDDIIASVRVQDGEVSFAAVDVDQPRGLNCDIRC